MSRSHVLLVHLISLLTPVSSLIAAGPPSYFSHELSDDLYGVIAPWY